MAGYLPGLDTMPPTAAVAAAEQQQNQNEKSLSAAAAAAERQRREEHLSAVAAAAAAAERRRREESPSVADKCWTYFASVVFVCAIVGVVVWLIVWLPTPSAPRYAVAIDAVSGLTANRTDLALDPEFNLTLRVASLSRRRHACVETGTYVEVAYRCVTLAATATTMTELCAGPREMREQQLVATGTRVRVPGAVLDSLAADMRHGELVFQVTVWWSGNDYADDLLVASCGGRRVGAAADELETSCHALLLCPDT